MDASGWSEATPFRVSTPAPGPLAPTCWDSEQLILNGFSPAGPDGFISDYGVKRSIEAIVWHDMEGYLPGAIARWNTGAAGAHLCILRDGSVVLTCKLANAAWHAGTDNNPTSGTYGRTPYWRSHNINPHAVGVELEGYVATGYTPAQMRAVRRVSDWLTMRFVIPRVHVQDQIAGHHFHSEISAARGDPGPLFSLAWAL